MCSPHPFSLEVPARRVTMPGSHQRPLPRRSLMARRLLLVAALLLLPAFVPLPSAQPDDQTPPTREELLREAVQALVKIQEDGGQWPYEGVYRVNKELPVGYRVGGTSIVAQTLMFAAPQDKDAQAAVGRGLDFVLKEL